MLQLCFYTEAIEAIQQAPAAAMHVLLGIGERRTLRPADFTAYYRRVRAGFLAALARGEATEPYRVDHCSLCEFRVVCDERWEREDHLGLVAGIRREQVTRLRGAGLGTLAQLAQAPPTTRVEHVAAHTFETLNDQAALQLSRRATGRLDWHTLPAEVERGFARLPRPSPGDVVFDIEGDPFWEPARGLHFLLGLLTSEAGRWRYRAIWAHDRAGERQAFETLVDFFRERLAQFPDMHVYHYGAYEPTALKQLMGVYATREDAVDALLRAEIFVDLHSVVRQGLRAGVPSYSLKHVEALPVFHRQAQVTSGTRAILAYEGWMESHASARLDEIATYNEEDCLATLGAARLADRAPAGRRRLGGAAGRAARRRRQAADRRPARGAAAGAVAGGRDRHAALAGGRAPGVSPARGAPGVVVVLRPLPDVGRRAGRRRRGHRAAGAGRRPRPGRAVARPAPPLPTPAAQAGTRRHAARSGNGQGRGHAREARRGNGRAGSAADVPAARCRRRSSRRGPTTRRPSARRWRASRRRCTAGAGATGRWTTSWPALGPG